MSLVEKSVLRWSKFRLIVVRLCAGAKEGTDMDSALIMSVDFYFDSLTLTSPNSNI
jgi:hypothetical protein